MGRNNEDFQRGAPDQHAAWSRLSPEERAWVLSQQRVKGMPWERPASKVKPPSNPKQTPRQTGKPTPEKYKSPVRPKSDGSTPAQKQQVQQAPQPPAALREKQKKQR